MSSLAMPGVAQSPAETNAVATLKLEPIHRLKAVGEKVRFVTQKEIEFEKPKPAVDRVAFRAVISSRWPPGLMPIFQVEKTNRYELRRRPPRGQENFTEPLFFILPPVEEPDAANIAGRWDVIAADSGGSKKYFGWDLAPDGVELSGRFDQDTDYRFGFIAGGTWRANAIEFRVEYIEDRYHVSGRFHEGRMKGTWRRTDDFDQGLWEATRGVEARVIPPAGETIPLHEWRRGADNARHYDTDPDWKRAGWEREPRPLGRVWRE